MVRINLYKPSSCFTLSIAVSTDNITEVKIYIADGADVNSSLTPLIYGKFTVIMNSSHKACFF